MNLLIVSGLSGSGKTIALQALEDAGCYCIDNLPAALLPQLASQLRTILDRRVQNVAVGIDARNRAFLADVPQALEQLRALGVAYRIVFLEAEEAILIKRYKETRRRHPMLDDRTSLTEAIRLEKELLAPLADAATVRIDTTQTTPHELRHQLIGYARSPNAGVTLQFLSFGFKHGTPLDADYVFDVRCLPNPYWQPELRALSGLDEEVSRFLEQYDEVHEMFAELRDFLERWLPRFEREDRTYLTIAIGCTGGMHRSVYLAKRLAEHFAAKGLKTQLRHRELKPPAPT